MSNSVKTYKIFADFYDLYVGKFNADFDFYKSYCNPIDKIIEIGCGTGRILNYLLKLGCKITGVDISQDMLNKAAEKLKEWIISGDLYLINHSFAVDKLNGRFDKGLLTFYTFNYIFNNPADFLHNVYKSLADNGLLLMDLFYPNSLLDKSIDGKWINKEFLMDGVSIRIKDKRTMKGNVEHRQQVFDINGNKTKIYTERKYYSPTDLADCLQTAGFKKVEFSYNYDYKEFTKMIDEAKLKNNYIVKAKK